MAADGSGIGLMWQVRVQSKYELNDADHDFIAELASEEARAVVPKYTLVLHDIEESERYSILLVEGNWRAIRNLVSVLQDNTSFGITCRHLG